VKRILSSSQYSSGFIARLGFIICVLGVCLPVAAQPIKIFFFDPDANLKNVGRLKAQMQSYLNTHDQEIHFQPFTKSSIFEHEMSVQAPQFALVSSLYLGKGSREFKLTPILIPAREGKLTYRKVLVAIGDNVDKNNLVGKTLATTLVGESGRRWLDSHVLKALSLKADSLRLIVVTKDIDALLALSFRQVDLALVAPHNIDVLKRVNPMAVNNLKILVYSHPILRSPLCSVGDVPPKVIERVTELFMGMSKTPLGQKTLNLLGFDEWKAFKPGMDIN